MKEIFSRIKAIHPFAWEIPILSNHKMNVPARIYTNAKMLKDMSTDTTLKQLVNVAALPGIVEQAIAMPDAHQGYGFPIGGVAATEFPYGHISPGGIGYDINCGVRLLISDMHKDEIKNHLGKLTARMMSKIPTGLGGKGDLKLSIQELNSVLKDGAKWTLEHGFANKYDLECIESNGTLAAADPKFISNEAKERGKSQLGTLGSGNHFVEIGYVDKIFDKEVAKAFGLANDIITLMIHTGSRGLGHQTATDYIKRMNSYVKTNNLILPDRQLACAPLNSGLGENYFSAMCASANFAFANRQVISSRAREVWYEFFGKDHSLTLLYDVAHNIAKIETHKVQKKGPTKLIVHRKGATRAFGPNNPELPRRCLSQAMGL